MMKQRDLVKLLKKNGWWFLRNGGNHDIYTNGKDVEPIPRHKEITETTAKAIIRKLGLK
jgi:mRNA interferase HicA